MPSIGISLAINRLTSVVGVASSAWTPASLGADLALWLDADDASTITLQGGGGPGPGGSDHVAQWDDKSGNGNHATQDTASSQPTYNATGFNSKPALMFDGIGDWLDAGTGINLGSQHFIVAAVMLDVIASFRFICKWGATTGTQSWLFSPAVNGHRHIVNVGGNIRISQSLEALTTSPTLYGGELQAGVLKAFVNGTEGATTLTGIGTPQATNTTVTLGRLNTTASDYTDMVAAEYVIVNGANATVANRQKAEGYLAWKWGLAENLPPDHPYRVDGSFFGFGSFQALSPSGSDLFVTSDGDVFIVQ
jgi:hypothetical protein